MSQRYGDDCFVDFQFRKRTFDGRNQRNDLLGTILGL